MYFGDYEPGAIIPIPWNTFAIAGESITRATNGTVQVYKNADATTEVTTGVTDTEDFDGKTGMHLAKIDTSSDGTFYSAGASFQVAVVGATIDGKTINAWLGTFTLRMTSALMPTTAGRKLDVTATGEAGIDWGNIGAPTTTVNLSGTTVKTATDVETDTQDIQGRLPAALVSGRMDSNVQAMANNVVTAAAIATDAIGASELAADAVTEIQSGLATSASISALNNLSAAQVNAEVDTALADYDAPTKAELDTAQAAIIDGVLDAVRISKNAALANFEFFMRDSSDHVSGKTGLTVTAQRSIDGGAFGACANAAAEVGSGVYKISLDAADLNGDVVTLKFTATGADPTVVTIVTQPRD